MRQARFKQSGFTYLGILAAIVIIGMSLATVGVVWSMQARRDREAQLLFIGDQYRQAIGRYHSLGGVYPRSLDELLTDTRVPVARRFLRRLYPDPITGAADWELIRAADGGIMGVASNSHQKPIKAANFPLIDKAFENTECYCGWKFVYVGKQQNTAPGRRRDLTPLPKN
jgi:type II secretory pathway pseudopilin PulG